uniref:Uncharacterized protein n=1 Tax=Macrostomum lignano TaxID=282301 RepID=A0A1I8F960_9PLAT
MQAVVDKNNAEDEAAQSDAGERAAGSRRQSEMIGQSEWRSRDELDFSSQGLTMAPELSVRQDAASLWLNLSSPTNNLRGLPPEISNLTQLRHCSTSAATDFRCAHPAGTSPACQRDGETMAELRELLLSRVQPDAHSPRPLVHRFGLEKLDIKPEKSAPSRRTSHEAWSGWFTLNGARRLGDQDSAGGDRLLRRSGEPSAVRRTPIDSLPDSLRELNRLHRRLHHQLSRVRVRGVDAEKPMACCRGSNSPPRHIPVRGVSSFPSCWRWNLEACKVGVELNIAAKIKFPAFTRGGLALSAKLTPTRCVPKRLQRRLPAER